MLPAVSTSMARAAVMRAAAPSVAGAAARLGANAKRTIMTDAVSGLTDEQVQLRDTVHKFAQEHLAPHATQIDKYVTRGL